MPLALIPAFLGTLLRNLHRAAQVCVFVFADYFCPWTTCDGRYHRVLPDMQSQTLAKSWRGDCGAAYSSIFAGCVAKPSTNDSKNWSTRSISTFVATYKWQPQSDSGPEFRAFAHSISGGEWPGAAPELAWALTKRNRIALAVRLPTAAAEPHPMISPIRIE